jgi:hypothetical protein
MNRTLQAMVVRKKLTIGTRNLMHSLSASNPLAEHSPNSQGKQQDDSPSQTKADRGEIRLDSANQRMQQLKHISFSIATNVLTKLIESMRFCNLARERVQRSWQVSLAHQKTARARHCRTLPINPLALSPIDACNAPQSHSIRKEYHPNLSEVRDSM